jgi:hypothetical protein
MLHHSVKANKELFGNRYENFLQKQGQRGNESWPWSGLAWLSGMGSLPTAHLLSKVRMR